jgi:hypothetical protein
MGDFDAPEANAGTCSFELTIPSISISVTLPSLLLAIPPIPIPLPQFSLSCDLAKPISVTKGVPPGGGRKSVYDKDPDETDL